VCFNLILQNRSIKAWRLYEKIKDLLKLAAQERLQLLHHLSSVSVNADKQFIEPKSFAPFMVQELKKMNRSQYVMQAHDKSFVKGIEEWVKLNGSYPDLTAQLTQLKSRGQQSSDISEEKMREEARQFSQLKLQKFQTERAAGKSFLRVKQIWPVFRMAGAFMVAAVLTAIAVKAIYSRSACTKWDQDFALLKKHRIDAESVVTSREIEYLDRAKLNCKLKANRGEEVRHFCDTGYLMQNIPIIWHLPSGSPPDKVCHQLSLGPMLDIPEVKLTCHAHSVLNARSYVKDVNKRLEYLKAQRPLNCG
jgi:hypothetical protein